MIDFMVIISCFARLVQYIARTRIGEGCKRRYEQHARPRHKDTAIQVLSIWTSFARFDKFCPNGQDLIAQNKRARHEYFIEETHEAGLALEGWEGQSHHLHLHQHLKHGGDGNRLPELLSSLSPNNAYARRATQITLPVRAGAIGAGATPLPY